MNEEMKAKLAKYMKTNGYYDTEAIRIDEGASRSKARFLDIFGGGDEDTPEVESELLAAAKAYNEAKMNEQDKNSSDDNVELTFTVSGGEEHVIGDLTIAANVYLDALFGNRVHVYGWNNTDTEDEFGDCNVDIVEIELNLPDDCDDDEEFTVKLTRKQIEDALVLYNSLYMSEE